MGSIIKIGRTEMTNEEKFEQLEKRIIDNSNAIMGMQYGRKALVKEWKVYEDAYIEYLKKKNRFRNFLWRLYRKITFRNTKLTRKELNKHVARKMARVFYKKG